MKRVKKILLLLAAVYLVVLPVRAGDGVVINLLVPDNPYGEIRLDEKLRLYMSTINEEPVYLNPMTVTMPNERGHVLDFESLYAMGLERNCAYVVDINFDRIDLETRKTSVLPQLINRFRVYAVISGWIRIVDVNQGQMVKLKSIQYEVKAKDRWQFTDDDIHDPDLFLPIDKKVLIFNRLEDEAASRLYDEIIKLVRGE